MLEMKNISVDVDGAKEILKDVSLTVPDDSFTVITGPNGGGKSTLAKVIAGIMRPSAGRILLDGVDISDWDITRRAQNGVSFAFQQPVRFKGLTVRDLLELACGHKAKEAELCAFLSDVGLCAREYIGREVNESLSGGEIKRIEIAMAMARGSRLTVFDEPEAGIDLWSFTNLIEVFKRLRRQVKGSVVVISHQERILDIADHIVVLANGRISKQGTRADILPTLIDAGEACAFCPRKDA